MSSAKVPAELSPEVLGRWDGRWMRGTPLDIRSGLDRSKQRETRRPRVSRSLAALLFALILPSCSSPTSIPLPVERTPYVYRVGPLDVLAIAVWNEPGLEEVEVIVTPDGHISFPLVQGTVDVTDLTLSEIAAILRDKVLELLKEPTVTVTLLESRSAQVQVLGEITRQGRVPYQKNLTLIEAVGEAGGVDWATAKVGAVRVVRGALSDPVLFDIDLNELLTAQKRDIRLEPGDIVVVPAKWVTRYSRYMTQLLQPIGIAVGAASTAGAVGQTPGSRN
jgi:polysaccharide export outer membrane protein